MGSRRSIPDRVSHLSEVRGLWASEDWASRTWSSASDSLSSGAASRSSSGAASRTGSSSRASEEGSSAQASSPSRNYSSARPTRSPGQRPAGQGPLLTIPSLLELDVDYLRGRSTAIEVWPRCDRPLRAPGSCLDSQRGIVRALPRSCSSVEPQTSTVHP
jgi:hypothetical protein